MYGCFGFKISKHLILLCFNHTQLEKKNLINKRYVMHYCVFVIHLVAEERSDCFISIKFLMHCACQCSVAFPCSAFGWSAVCDCGIFGLYSLLVAVSWVSLPCVCVVFPGHTHTLVIL